jgi:hypothetical protein
MGGTTISTKLVWYYSRSTTTVQRMLQSIKWTRSKADPCLSYKWIDNKLVIFLLWVDDCLITGQVEDVEKETNDWRTLFDTTDEGEMTEYVVCKIERTK